MSPKTVLITGCSTGIGHDLARRFEKIALSIPPAYCDELVIVKLPFVMAM
jgi:hypothetical protein